MRMSGPSRRAWRGRASCSGCGSTPWCAWPVRWSRLWTDTSSATSTCRRAGPATCRTSTATSPRRRTAWTSRSRSARRG
eukprot:2915964-Alexandrium_andersonii.AAC.1